MYRPMVFEITLPRCYDPVLTTKEKSLIKLEGEVEALNKEIEALVAAHKTLPTYAAQCENRKKVMGLKLIRAQKNQEIRNAW